jgi:hypothetical protein
MLDLRAREAVALHRYTGDGVWADDAGVLERLGQLHRWGNTPELHQLEADAFFDGERPCYKSEAEQNGYQVFETAEEALPAALELLR